MSDIAARPLVLVLDDEKNIRESIEIVLTQNGFKVIGAHDIAAAMRAFAENVVDLLILDIRLGELDGITFFKRLRADGIDPPTIFISGHATLTEAAQAVKSGGYDFLEKPFTAEKIAVTVRRAWEMSALKTRLRLAEGSIRPDALIGDSRQMNGVAAAISKVAKANASVLITGESGTGKELVANAVHAQSERSSHPFVKVNCSAIPDSLVESELFGHEKGAFTGAASAKRGLFEIAHRGSVFLDEVADLSLSAQAKILRVLQSGEIQKIGSEKSLQVDVRVLSATHKDLEQLVKTGLFREDLYYRLNVVPIRVPSLRERGEDIPLLVHYFLRHLSERNNLRGKEIETDAILELQRYAWPGNVRELQNMLERVLIMSGDSITIDDLPERVFSDSTIGGMDEGSLLRQARERAEREAIVAALRRHAGNVSSAANDLKIRRTYLHRRIRALNIAKKEYF